MERNMWSPSSNVNSTTAKNETISGEPFFFFFQSTFLDPIYANFLNSVTNSSWIVFTDGFG